MIEIAFTGKATESGYFNFWPFGGPFIESNAIRVDVKEGDTVEDVQRKLEKALADRDK